MEANNLLNIEFKTIVRGMLKELRRRDELSDNINNEMVIIKKDRETIKKNQSEMNNTKWKHS